MASSSQPLAQRGIAGAGGEEGEPPGNEDDIEHGHRVRSAAVTEAPRRVSAGRDPDREPREGSRGRRGRSHKDPMRIGGRLRPRYTPRVGETWRDGRPVLRRNRGNTRRDDPLSA